MVQVSAFPGIIHQTPRPNEPTHYQSAQTLEQGLNTRRANVEQVRQSIQSRNETAQYTREGVMRSVDAQGPKEQFSTIANGGRGSIVNFLV